MFLHNNNNIYININNISHTMYIHIQFMQTAKLHWNVISHRNYEYATLQTMRATYKTCNTKTAAIAA